MEHQQFRQVTGGFSVVRTNALAPTTNSAQTYVYPAALAGNRQITLDTETTGLSPAQGHRIVEIGAVELIDGETTGRSFHTYLDPDRDIDPDAQAVHGICRDFLVGKPSFKNVIKPLLAFIGSSELLIHNASFDVGFLDAELARVGAVPLHRHCLIITDTLAIARSLHPKQSNSLDALCARYGIDASERTIHGALLDAGLLAKVYRAMLQA